MALVAVLLLWAALGGCRSTTDTIEVKIGLAAPFEGAGRALGYEVLAAVRLAVEERNAAGGVHGRPIAIVALNDEDDPGQAVLQAQKLALDPAVVGVVGHWSREATEAALPHYVEAGLPLAIPDTGGGAPTAGGIIQVRSADGEPTAPVLASSGGERGEWVALTREAAAAFVQAYRAQNGDEPSRRAVLAYAAARTILETADAAEGWPSRRSVWEGL